MSNSTMRMGERYKRETKKKINVRYDCVGSVDKATGKPIFVCTIVKYSTVDCLNVSTRYKPFVAFSNLFFFCFIYLQVREK